LNWYGAPVTEPVVLLNCREAAERLHVSQITVRRYGRSGLIDQRRVGPWLVKFTEESVEALKQKDAA
jgi:predicted site-specific integrase-resolvase